MTTTDLHHQYGISSLRNVPSGEERGETDVFAGYWGASKVHYGRCASGVLAPVFLVYWWINSLAAQPGKDPWSFPHAALFPGKCTID